MKSENGDTGTSDWKTLASELRSLLNLQWSPVAITFSEDVTRSLPVYEAEMSEPTPDGRTGKVAAGCVFWIKGTERTFTTIPEDHGNCSVGSLTHGLKTINEIVENSDVQSLLECEWVTKEMVSSLPVITRRPNFITYGPLEDSKIEPDVVLLRINAIQAMILHDAVPRVRLEGKPQCHIIPIAKEQNEVAVSVGCMLSRVRTGMRETEMTCAIPAARLAEVVDLLKTAKRSDTAVAAYASEDAQRFT